MVADVVVELTEVRLVMVARVEKRSVWVALVISALVLVN